MPLRFIRTHKPFLIADGERYKHRRFRTVCWRELDQFSSELSQFGGELGQVFIKSYHYSRVIKAGGGERGGLVGGCPNHKSRAYFPAKWTSPQTRTKSSRVKKGQKRMQKKYKNTDTQFMHWHTVNFILFKWEQKLCQTGRGFWW